MANPIPFPLENQALAKIVGRIDLDEVAGRLEESFRSQIGGYHGVPDLTITREIREVSRQNLETFYRVLLDQRPPDEADLAPFRASVKQRAAQGVRLEDVLQAYRSGGRLAWHALLEAAEPHEQDSLLVLVDLVLEYVDRVSAAVAQAYLEETQELISEEERKVRDLLDAITADRPLDLALTDLAREMTFPLLDEYRPFATALPAGLVREHARTAAALRKRGILAVTDGGRILGLLTPDQASSPLGGRNALTAVGDLTARGELANALQESCTLVDIGHRLGRTGELRPSDHLPELLLAASPRLAEQIRRRALADLEDYSDRRGTDLVETLAAFVGCGCDRRAAAAELHVHPNTVDYRLGRAEELTGLQLGRPGDLMVLTLALMKRDLDAAG